MDCARPAIAFIGSITSLDVCAASYASLEYFLMMSRRPSISPVVHVTPSSISVLVSPAMFKNRARNARALSAPLLCVTAVMVPIPAASSSIVTCICAATGATMPMPSAIFSMLVAYLLSSSFAPSRTFVSFSMEP